MHSGVRNVLVCLAFAAAILSPSASQALIGTIDDVPAATLLLPYFEVDLDNAERHQHAVLGQQRVGDGDPGPRHVWTDLSVHVSTSTST